MSKMRYKLAANDFLVLWMFEFLRHLELKEALGLGAQETRPMISKRYWWLMNGVATAVKSHR